MVFRIVLDKVKHETQVLYTPDTHVYSHRKTDHHTHTDWYWYKEIEKNNNKTKDNGNTANITLHTVTNSTQPL